MDGARRTLQRRLLDGHRQQALSLSLLSDELALPTNGFGLATGILLRRFFVCTPCAQFPEMAFALKLFLQHPHGLFDIIVSYENLHAFPFFVRRQRP